MATGNKLLAAALGLLAAATIAACGQSGTTTVTSGTAGGASCAVRDQSAYFASARIVFVGIMLPGPVVSTGQGAVLASPARVKVVRYLKGNGPLIVTVITGVTKAGGADVASEDGIQPLAGQRWEIYATTRDLPYQTSICSGSALMPGTS